MEFKQKYNFELGQIQSLNDDDEDDDENDLLKLNTNEKSFKDGDDDKEEWNSNRNIISNWDKYNL